MKKSERWFLSQSNPSSSTVWKKTRVQPSHRIVSGFYEQNIQQLIKQNVSFASFFEKGNIHPDAHLIAGMVCG